MKFKRMSTYEIHKELFEVAREIQRICEENQIRFFLGFGSLLGAIRDGGFIPWDDDMDFFILREDWNKFNLCVLEQLNKDKFFFINAFTRKNYPYWSLRIRIGVNSTYRKMGYFKEDSEFQSGIFADIFVLEYVPDNWNLLKLQQWGLRVIDELIARRSMKKEYQGNISLCRKLPDVAWGKRLTLEMCNMIRNSVQTCLATYNAAKLLVPMGPRGKYPLEKVLYDKEWFDTKAEVPFQLLKDGEVIDTLYLPAPYMYEKILEKTYGNWKRKPHGKKPKGLSYWVIE